MHLATETGEYRKMAERIDLRNDFPLLRNTDLAFLDSAASTQKPEKVIEAMSTFYQTHYANVHRGVYRLSQVATLEFEASREIVRNFFNASGTEEIIFTRGTTEAINLVAHSWGRHNLKAGDRILVTLLEHHSNIVPWQLLAEERGLLLDWVELTPEGEIDLADFERKLALAPKLFCVTALANALGIAPPIDKMVDLASRSGAMTLVDAAQGAPHGPIDVQALNCDFLACSSHKLYGPTGIGVLYGKRKHLENMPPFMGGGDMIRSVSRQGSTFNELPYKFEAGTPPIVEAIGFGAAINYLEGIGWSKIRAHEKSLVSLLEQELSQVDGISILGPLGKHDALVTFTSPLVHAHDLGQFLDSRGVACRAGHHCAQPLMQHFGLTSSVRASIGIYNSAEDVFLLARALSDAIKFFTR